VSAYASKNQREGVLMSIFQTPEAECNCLYYCSWTQGVF